MGVGRDHYLTSSLHVTEGLSSKELVNCLILHAAKQAWGCWNREWVVWPWKVPVETSNPRNVLRVWDSEWTLCRLSPGSLPTLSSRWRHLGRTWKILLSDRVVLYSISCRWAPSSALCTGTAASQVHKLVCKHKWTPAETQPPAFHRDVLSKFPAVFPALLLRA